VVVAVNGVEAKALVKGFGFDVVADGVSHGDTAQIAASVIVKGTEALEQVCAQGPRLAA
jgi:hypothetical protein